LIAEISTAVSFYKNFSFQFFKILLFRFFEIHIMDSLSKILGEICEAKVKGRLMGEGRESW